MNQISYLVVQDIKNAKFHRHATHAGGHHRGQLVQFLQGAHLKMRPKSWGNLGQMGIEPANMGIRQQNGNLNNNHKHSTSKTRDLTQEYCRFEMAYKQQFMDISWLYFCLLAT